MSSPYFGFSRLDDDNTLSAALLGFSIRSMKTGRWRGSKKYLGRGDDFDYVDTQLFPASGR